MKPLIRPANHADLAAIVALLADDALGARRERNETPLPQAYETAFGAIDNDPNHHLMVAEQTGQIVGTLQLSILPYLTYCGGKRAQIEAVRVARDLRGSGLGSQLFQWAIEQAHQLGCHVVQLTTDKARPEALRFYEKLGFKASHEGMKLHFT